MAEWSNAPDSKSGVQVYLYRGFESLSFRQQINEYAPFEVFLFSIMLFITSIIASVLTVIFVRLSFAMIGFRRKNKVGLGSGGHEELERAVRAQGNFAEYVPIGIILIAC